MTIHAINHAGRLDEAFVGEVRAMIQSSKPSQKPDPMEEAEAFAVLHDAGLSHRQIAARVGVSVGQVSKRIALLRLPQDVQDAIRDGHLQPHAARRDYHEPAMRPAPAQLLYLTRNDARNALKIGASAPSESRLRTWRQRGWEVVEVWDFHDRRAVFAVERTVKAWWRRCGWGPAYHESDGYTETVSLADVDEATTCAFVEGIIHGWTLADAQRPMNVTGTRRRVHGRPLTRVGGHQ